uniref:Uncharacterized protein n=1 Tax=Aegilops tauschii subsp. strangulata TaxID=200361 RepID=A0A453P4H3_AEGTS
AFHLHLQRISTLSCAAGPHHAPSQPTPNTPPRTANAPPPCAFPTPATFHHQRHLMPAPHLHPIPLSRHDPTPSSSTTSPAPACSFSSDATHLPSSLGRRPVLRRRQRQFQTVCLASQSQVSRRELVPLLPDALLHLAGAPAPPITHRSTEQFDGRWN